MKGKVIDSDGRNIILKVLKYFEEEKANNQLTFNLDQVTSRTCAATGISKRTLMNIKKEAKILLQQASSSGNSGKGIDAIRLTAPGKKRKPSSKRIVLSTYELNAVRNIVNSFNTEKKEIPTINKILAIAQRDLNFKGQKSTLRRILINELGYRFKKNNNSRPVLTQKPKTSTVKCEKDSKTVLTQKPKTSTVKCEKDSKTFNIAESQAFNIEVSKPLNIEYGKVENIEHSTALNIEDRIFLNTEDSKVLTLKQDCFQL